MRNRTAARVLSVSLVAGAALLGTAAVSPAAETGPVGLRFVNAGGTFGDPSSGGNAVTYDKTLVPVGARAHVLAFGSEVTGTQTALVVAGLQPDREYGAHAHAKPCGATGAVAGPHFQHVPDPVTPSVDPAFANPHNEIWLDFTTNATGIAFALSSVNWVATDERAPKSVVIHEMHTRTGAGEAGTAGARLACIDVDF
ncbi:MAG: superoxide dismutase [Sciscionella sp.]